MPEKRMSFLGECIRLVNVFTGAAPVRSRKCTVSGATSIVDRLYSRASILLRK
jgi:hypothetical protein